MTDSTKIIFANHEIENRDCRKHTLSIGLRNMPKQRAMMSISRKAPSGREILLSETLTLQR